MFGLPKDLGLKGALFADVGTLFGYQGKTDFRATPTSPCLPGDSVSIQGCVIKVGNTDAATIRSSVGASVLWASPLGPIRFDYAFVLSKAQYDVGQAFRFSGGGSF